MADDDGCGDIDSGTAGTCLSGVLQAWKIDKNTHKEVVVVVCLPRIPDQGGPQRPRIHQAKFRMQRRTQKRLLDRLRSEMSV